MAIESIIVLLIIGLIAGWLAGKIMRGAGFGLVGNIVVGIVGAFIGSYVLGALGVGLGGGIISAIVGATLGAVILLFIIDSVRRSRRSSHPQPSNASIPVFGRFAMS